MVSARGHNGRISVDDEWVTITRTTINLAHRVKRERRVLLASITAVQMSPAKLLTNGFIRLSVLGSHDLHGGVIAAASDENAVVFTRGQQRQFEVVRQVIEAHISSRAGGVPQQPAPDLATQLAQLAQLHQSGALSPDEYAAAKARLLGQ